MNTLYFVAENGLSNRLFGAISAYRIALILGYKFMVIWPYDEVSIECKFEEIFNGDVNAINCREVSLSGNFHREVRSINGRSFLTTPPEGMDVIIAGWHHFIFLDSDLATIANGDEGLRGIELELRNASSVFLGHVSSDSKGVSSFCYDLGIHFRVNTVTEDRYINSDSHRSRVTNWNRYDDRFFVDIALKACSRVNARQVFVTTSNNRLTKFVAETLTVAGLGVVYFQDSSSDTDKDSVSSALRDLIELQKCRIILRDHLSTFSALPSFLNAEMQLLYGYDGELIESIPRLFSGSAL